MGRLLNIPGRDVPSGASVLACLSASTDVTILRSRRVISDGTPPRKAFPPLRPSCNEIANSSVWHAPTAYVGYS